jgi:DNA (cytosine-5)-methyltransferase 1
MTYVSLFSGAGINDYGFELAGWECLAQVEIDKAANDVRKHHFPDVQHYEDVRSFDASKFRGVDAVIGGFPCVDISTANTSGRRDGLNGKHSGLWREFLRIVGECEPVWVVVENSGRWEPWVPHVRADLASLGYATVSLALQACDFGLPHKRARAFVVAHADGDGEPLRAIHAEASGLRPVPVDVGHWEKIAARIVGADDGATGRIHRRARLKMLGNGWSVPQAEWIARRIIEVAA